MCPLKYWQEHQYVFPSFAEIAIGVLGIPASSAPVERLFSVAGKVFRPERCRLADSTFEKLMYIQCNNKCFKTIIYDFVFQYIFIMFHVLVLQALWKCLK